MDLKIEKNGFKEISLDEAKEIMLNILINFKRICEKHQLTYWLDSGTLIGAVRHKGFIPWDDDIDVGMPRDDYEKFVKICQKELPSHLFLQTKESDLAYSQYYAKIRDKNTLYIEHEQVNREIAYNQGVFIDIFVINYISDKIYPIYPFLRFSRKFFKNTRFYIRYFNVDIYQKYIKLMNKLHNKDNNFIVERVDRENRTLTLTHMEKKDFFPLIEVEFENHIFPSPINYDKYLTQKYGDYMSFPPIEEQEKPRHHHKIYVKEEGAE